MKLSERVLDAMSGIDEKLLKDSEEYTGKKKTFDLRILAMSAAVLLLAVLVIPHMPKQSGSAVPATADQIAKEEEYPAEAAEAEEEKTAETSAAEYGTETAVTEMTDELQRALQEQGEVTIIAEPAETVPEDMLNDMCAELQEKGYDVSEKDGKLIIITDSASFDAGDMPSGCGWLLDLYN
ncbi:MAG: hypothetical protein K6G61_10340 [Solobacterium sp.]|nr:hypothetical protein [Solobacterium sp.]